MGIKSILGSVIGFVGGMVPQVMKLGEAMTLLLGLIKVGIASGDKDKLMQACDLGMALADGFDDLGKETREFFTMLRAALADGELSGTEIKALTQEAADDVAVIKGITAHVTEISKLAHSSF